ncbi:E3 ubiquitin-protein ligase MIB2-like isoform X2 [Amblyomma americanum]
MGNNISIQSLSSAQESSLPNRTASRLGQRVMRGPDWKWDSQDGGEGYVGTLIAVEHPLSDAAEPSPVWVAWDHGVIERYRVSRTGPCDLRLYDSGPAGIHFPSVTCDACCKSGIGGTRWKCSECCDYELCHTCYMADKHSLDHAFLRYDAPGATGIKVAPRKGSLKRVVRGIFERAKVVRGPHWKRGDDDGADCTIGTVLSVRDGPSGTFRSTARVQWPDGDVETYSVGHGGDVALKFVESAAGGTVYVDHMPLIAPIQLKDDCDTEFFTGARVGVVMDVETFRLLQHGHGDWVPEMAEVINRIGVVQDVTSEGDVRVCFGTGERWSINPAALIKVPSFSVGDMVKVVEDLPTLESLEYDDSDSFEPRAEVLGSTGTVTEICNSQDVRVNIDGCDYTFNPFSLALIQRHLDGPSQIAAAADTHCSSEAQKELEARLHELEEALQCAICMDHRRDVLFLCGHGCCDDCSQALSVCHICRQPITQKIPIY